MFSNLDLSRFSQTVRGVQGNLQDLEVVTASMIVAGILASHSEYGNHIGGKLELVTDRGNQRHVDDWLMDAMSFYPPDLLKKSRQKVIDGRLVINALAQIDTVVREQRLMHRFLLALEKEIDPVLLVAPASEASQSEGAVDTSGTGPKGRTLELRAGYWADDEMGKDKLDLDAEIGTLAAVLCDNSVVPPLSLGLFGDWGSGKSFFMHLLRKRVAMLAEAARSAETNGEESLFCTHVRQITFNSWHYSDANLWASLVTHIFESLADDEDAREEGKEQSDEERRQAELERNNLLSELHSAKALKRELETAESRNEDIDRDLARMLDTFYQQSVGEVLKEPEDEADEKVQKALDKIKNRLGLKDDPSVDQIRMVVNDSRSLGRSLAMIWRYMKPRQHVLTVVWVLLVIAVVLWSQVQFDIQELIAAVLATLAGWAVILKKPMEILRGIAGDAATLLEDLERRRDEEAGRLQREKERLQERIRTLEHDYEALTSGGRFAHLIEKRARGDTYRGQLGVISMIHRDFKQMSDLLLQSRKERRAITFEGKGSAQEDREQAPAIPRIDRIILYIDDLDRCGADRVVEVLEAVHLLLAEPLFVVVVGVDPRWLLRSLEKHYTGLLTTTDGIMNPDVAADWQSTPMNYLEKIFQIPYTLRPMSKTGFERLMESLVPIPKKEETYDRELPDSDEFKKGLVVRATGKPAGDNWRGEYDKIVAELERQREADEAGKTEEEVAEMRRDEERTRKNSMHESRVAGINVRPKQLLIDNRELEFMKKLRLLIGTPRAAKRLSNIYRLLRASLDDQELHGLIDTETGTGDYPVVQILLAIVVGYPRLATFVFQKIYYSKDIPDWNALIKGLEPKDEQELPLNLNDERGKDSGAFHNSVRPKMTLDEAKLWSRLCRRLERVREDVAEAFPQDLVLYRDWVFRVARYSFHTGRLVVSNQEEE